MKSTVLWALLILNAVLAAAFISRITGSNKAVAQPVQRRMGDFLAVSGEVQGASGGVVFIVDESNELLGAMGYDDNRNAIDVMPVIDLKPIFQQADGGGRK